MEKPVFTNKHYNTPGHAHELTFSVYRSLDIFTDKDACDFLLTEIATARDEFKFRLWAYVIMPNHVHLLLWPLENSYEIQLISKSIKGRMAKRFIRFCSEKGEEGLRLLKGYHVVEKGKEHCRIWQTGGGFDRNLWSPEAIHQSIEYIEANPVRKKLAEAPEQYHWSSAYARIHNAGVVPDSFNVPVKMANPQN